MSDSRQITPAEFELVEILWKSDRSLSVSQVRRELDNGRRPAYTTVMTLLDKLARKGSLQRAKRGKAYYYRPAVDRDSVLGYQLENFARSYFGGELHAIQRFLAGKTLGRRTSTRRTAKGPAKGGRKSKTGVSSQLDDEMDVVLL